MQNSPHPERRQQKDRRAKPTSPFSSSSLFGSREKIRRKEDKQRHHYVDRYSFRSAVTILVIIVLSMTDATFTLKLVALGAAKEINPVMDFFLQLGPITFLTVKYVLTGICLLCFLIFKNHSFLGDRVTGSSLIVAVLIIYAVLIFYELTLFYRLNSNFL